jgi:hypothetical protein
MLITLPTKSLKQAGRSGMSIPTGVIIKQSLLEMASGAVLYRKVIDYSTPYCSWGQRLAGTWLAWLSDPCICLTEFGKAIGGG